MIKKLALGLFLILISLSIFFIFFIILGVTPLYAFNAPGFVQLNQDFLFSSNSDNVVLRADVNINDEATPTLIQSTGRWYCKEGKKGVVSGYLAIDGSVNKSNQLAMVFNNCPGQHPFLLHAAVNLTKGTHNIELRVKVEGGAIVAGIGAGTQITVFTGLKNIQQWVIDSTIIDNNDWQSVFSIPLSGSNLPRLVEYSGSLEAIKDAGDAMTGIFLDDRLVSHYAIDDLLPWEDEIAPVNNQYVVPGDGQAHKLELKVRKWYVPGVYEPKLVFKLRPGGTLIVATGYPSSILPYATFHPFRLSQTEPEKSIVSQSFVITGNQPRSVLALAQGTWMGESNTGYGHTLAWLELDGQKYGNTSIQYFATGQSSSDPSKLVGPGSQRTFSVVALINDVKPGSHILKLKVSQELSTIPDLIGGGDLTAIIAPPSFTIQGYKLGCPEGTKITLEGAKESLEQPYFFYNVPVGTHTVSLELPAGSPPYDISYNPCDCCINHPEKSFISGSSHRFTKEIICEGDYNYYDLYWQCKRKGDLNNDGQVNSQDLKILLENWGDNPLEPKADLNGEGQVNGLDFGKMLLLVQ